MDNFSSQPGVKIGVRVVDFDTVYYSYAVCAAGEDALIVANQSGKS